jgi:SAM-dependent methyltransferase
VFVNVVTREAPAQVKSLLRAARNGVLSTLLRGNEVHCPVCAGDFRRFRAFRGRPNALCPRCGSLERHRAAKAILESQTNLFTDHLRVLHFAPEPGLSKLLRLAPNLDYETADLEPGLADRVVDITAIDAADGAFDVILCSHVLEHIPDDGQAMREIRRVLSPAGWAFLVVPFDATRTAVFEDPSIVTREDRLAAFGQEDHVRWYSAAGFEERLRKAGLSVRQVHVDNPDERRRFAVYRADVPDWAAICARG